METFLSQLPRRFALVTLVLLPFISICNGAPVPAESPIALPSTAPVATPSPAQNGLVPPRESSPAASITPSASVENSVVKIFSTMAQPDLYRPWSKESPAEFSGSGAIIPGNRILTNAHMVLHASQIQVQANQSGDKISATVEAFAPGIDLAVLKLDDPKFFDSHPPIH